MVANSEKQELRWGIITMWKKLGSTPAAARAMKVDPQLAHRTVERYKTTGTVDDRPRSGRPRAMSRKAATKAVQLLTGDACMSAKDAAKQLAARGLTRYQVSDQTLLAAAKEAAKEQGTPLHLRKGSPAAQLSTSHKQRRLEFAKSHISFSWPHVMFTDEVRIQLKYPGTAVGRRKWVKGDERYAAPKATKPLVACFYAGKTKWGTTKSYFVTGTSEHSTQYTNRKGGPASNATQLEYRDIMFEGLLPEGHRMFQEHSLSEWYFQQDGAKAHSHAADTIAEFNNSYSTRVQLLKGWPANSPDLSPIENVWSLVKDEVARKACKNIKQLKAAVQKALAGITPQTLANLFASMHDRMVEVKKHGGDRINY